MMDLWLTSRDADEVLAGGFVHLDVPVPDVVLVPPERHVPVGEALKQDQGLAIPPTLRRQTQRHAYKIILQTNVQKICWKKFLTSRSHIKAGEEPGYLGVARLPGQTPCPHHAAAVNLSL